MKKSTVALSSAAVLVLTGCSGGGANPGSNGGDDEVREISYEAACEAAKDEGPLDWWDVDPETSEKTIRMFNEKYPDIEVSFTSIKENDIAQRLVAEANANREPTADLVVGHAGAFQPLVDRDLIDEGIVWPQEISENLVSETNMVRVYRRINGLTYNTELVDPEDLPDRWEDLADPAWKGKISVHTTGIPFGYLAGEWGVDGVLEWAQEFKDVVDPEVIDGTTSAIVAAGSGEVPIAGSGRDSETSEQKAAGAPIDIKFLEPIITFDFHQAIPAGAEDVNAAICFGTWYVTDGAKDVLPLSFSTNVDLPPAVPEGAEVVVSDPADTAIYQEALRGVSEIWTSSN